MIHLVSIEDHDENDDVGCSTRHAYVSVRAPSDPELYSMLKRAAVRSLSCEVFPGREGLVWFGERGCLALSYAFRLRDSRSRGGTRWYSLMLLAGELGRLLLAHEPLLHAVRAYVSELQQCANVTFEREDKEKDKEKAAPPHSNAALRRRMMPGSAASLRPLEDLVNVHDLYTTLHLRAALLLRYVANLGRLQRAAPLLVASRDGDEQPDNIPDIELQRYVFSSASLSLSFSFDSRLFSLLFSLSLKASHCHSR